MVTKKATKKKPAAKAAVKAAVKVAVKAKSKPIAKSIAKPKAAAKTAAPVKAAKPAAKPVAAKQPVKVHARPVAHKPVAPVHHNVHQAPKPVAARPAATQAAQVQAKPQVKPQAKPAPAAAPKAPSFKVGELVVYPAHGVGKVTSIEVQEIAGTKLELYIVDFEKEKLRLKVPTNRAEQKGMRHLADRSMIEQAMKVIRGRPRIKRVMWSRRAQEYDAKINSGDMIAVAEVVRDLYRSERQPEQSYSERQLFEQALARFARELAAVRKIDDDQCIKEVEDYLARNAKRSAAEKTDEESAEEAA